MTRVKESPAYVSLVSDRTFPDWALPKTRFPYVTVELTGGVTVHNQQGSSALKQETLSFHVWARQPKQRDDVFEALRNILDGWTGVRDDADIRSVMFEADSDISESPVDGSGQPVYRKLISVEVWYAQPAATLT